MKTVIRIIEEGIINFKGFQGPVCKTFLADKVDMYLLNIQL